MIKSKGRLSKIGWNLTKLYVFVIAISLPQFGCHGGEDIKIADNTVGEFHSKLNSEKYHEIYGDTTDDFKKYTSESDFTELLKAIHHKLGNVQTAKNNGINVSYTTWGVFVNTSYDTTFENSRAQERFTILLRDKHAMLISYHITSRELVTR